MKTRLPKKTSTSSKPKSQSYVETFEALIRLGFEFPDGYKGPETSLKKLMQKYTSGEIISDSEAREVSTIIKERTVEINPHFNEDNYIKNAIDNNNPKITNIMQCSEGVLYTEESKSKFVNEVLPELAKIVLTESDIENCKISILSSLLPGCSVETTSTGKHIQFGEEKLYPIMSITSQSLVGIEEILSKDPNIKLIFLGTAEVTRKHSALRKLVVNNIDRIFRI
jgi:hypothetical protein